MWQKENINDTYLRDLGGRMDMIYLQNSPESMEQVGF